MSFLKIRSSFLLYIIIAVLIFGPSDHLRAQKTPEDNKKEDITKTPGVKDKRKRGKSVFNLGEIVVRERSVANIEDASTTTTISGKDIRERSNKTLNDALTIVPGMQVERHQKGHVRVKIRGFDQDKVAILIDGIPINDVYSTDVDISSIPVINVSRIIINRGVSSALYGKNGAIGSINVITRRPEFTFAEGNAEYGQYNNYTLNTALGGPIGNFYFWLSGTKLNSGGYKPSKKLDTEERRRWFDSLIRYDLYGRKFKDVSIPAKNDYIYDSGKWDNEHFRIYHLSAKSGYNLNKKTETGLTFYYEKKTGETNTYQVNSYSDYRLKDNYWQDPVFTENNIKKAALRNRSFIWKDIYRYSIAPYLSFKYDDFRLRANIFYSYKKAVQQGYASHDHSYFKGQPELFRAMRITLWEPFISIQEYSSYGTNIFPTIRLSKNNRLSFALIYHTDHYVEKEQAESPTTSPVIVEARGTDPYPIAALRASFLSLAIEDEAQLGKFIRATAGVSYDVQDFNRYKKLKSEYIYNDAYRVEDDSMLWGTRDSLNPVLGIVFDPYQDLLLFRASGAIKTRFPTLNEYSQVEDSEHDRNLKSERSYNGNVGFEIKMLKNKVIFRSDYFYNLVKNRIEKISGGEEPPVNIEKIVVQGSENIFTFHLKRIPAISDLFLQLSYTYLHARNKDNSHEEKVNKGEMLELTPEHQYTLELRFAFVTRTSLNIWGSYYHNQVMYRMKSSPKPDDVSVPYSTSYFETVRANDPLKIQVKIEQEITSGFSIYFLCKNITDDYNADPFNPGSGRMFYGGLNAKL